MSPKPCRLGSWSPVMISSAHTPHLEMLSHPINIFSMNINSFISLWWYAFFCLHARSISFYAYSDIHTYVLDLFGHQSIMIVMIIVVGSHHIIYPLVHNSLFIVTTSRWTYKYETLSGMEYGEARSQVPYSKTTTSESYN